MMGVLMICLHVKFVKDNSKWTCLKPTLISRVINALGRLQLCYRFHLSSLGILPNADVVQTLRQRLSLRFLLVLVFFIPLYLFVKFFEEQINYFIHQKTGIYQNQKSHVSNGANNAGTNRSGISSLPI